MTAPVHNRSKWLAVNALIALALVCLVVGVVAPMLTLKKLYFITNTFSVFSGVLALAQEGQYLLGIIIFAFSVILPCIKILLLFTVWNRPIHDDSRSLRLLHWLAALGRWSMLDVFVVAVLVATVKLGAIASIEIHYGLYVFAASVALIMLATYPVKKFVSVSG